MDYFVLLSTFAVTSILAPLAIAQDYRIQTRTDRLGQPDGGSVGTQFQNTLTVQSGEDGGNATLALTRMRNQPFLGRYFRTHLKMAVPFNSDTTDQADIGSLSKISAGTNLGVEWSYIAWKPIDEAHDKVIWELCDQYVAKLIPGYSNDHLSAAGAYTSGCSIEGLKDLDQLNSGIGAINTKRTECRENPQETLCDIFSDVLDNEDAVLAENFQEITNEMQPQLENEIDNAISGISIFTFGVSANQQQFNFVLPDTPTDVVTQRERGWATTLAFTRVHTNSFLTIGYSHETTYSGGQKTEICTPFGALGSLSCTDRMVGEPTEDTKKILFSEYRYLATARLGISPRTEFDVENSNWSVRIPIYLVPNDNRQLIAGVAFGWDDENGTGASVFIGKPFGLP